MPNILQSWNLTEKIVAQIGVEIIFSILISLRVH